MNRAGKTLLLILLIQCGILAAMYWPQQAAEMRARERALLTVSQGGIDEIRIGNTPDTEAVILKSGGRWVLPELENLPADALMVEKLLDGLTNTQANWPVARSTAARQRFQVADYHHQRRISLFSSGRQLATLYLGTSPGFRKVHARNADRDPIFSIAFNLFDAPGRSRDWIDRKLLQIRTPVRITADTYSIHREGGDWQTASGDVPDERELLALLSALRSLQVDGVASEQLQDALATSEADLLLQVEGLSGKISLGLFSYDGEHFISSSEFPFLFKLSAYDYDRLTSIDFGLTSHEETAQ